MRISLPLCLPLVVLFALIFVIPATAQQAQVEAILFYMDDCPGCEQLIYKDLPGWRMVYGDQLAVKFIEIVTLEDIDRLYLLGAAFGFAKEEISVPLLLVGDRALVGVEQILKEFPGLMDIYLTNGGVIAPDWEAIAGSTGFQAKQPGLEQPKSSGMTLAWIVWIGMFVALAFTFWVLWRAFDGVAIQEPEWSRLVIPVLSLLGLGVALYLAYVETTAAQAICGPVGDCNAVQHSSYAVLFGILPVGFLGVGGYLAILAAWLVGRFGAGVFREFAPLAILGMGLFGVLFSIYLTYLEIFVIRAVCMWCVTSAVLMTLVMLVSLPGGTRWLVEVEEE